jgi:hypothetical protein
MKIEIVDAGEENPRLVYTRIDFNLGETLELF